MKSSTKFYFCTLGIVNKVMKNLIVFIFIFCISGKFLGQKEKEGRYKNYFGLVFSPVIPNNFIGIKTLAVQDTSSVMTTTYNQKWSFQFGAIARFGLSEKFSLETGLISVRRIYDVNVSIPDSSINRSQKLTYINYDIPINGLFYVRMSDKIYANAYLGVSFVHYPSDVMDSVQLGAGKSIVYSGLRFDRTYFGFNAGIGAEYRTEKAGTFYIGGAAKVYSKPVLAGVASLKTSGTSDVIRTVTSIPGGYFSIDIRYFFPYIKSKKEQNNPLN